MKNNKRKIRKVFRVVYVVLAFLLLTVGLLVRFASDWTVEEFGVIPFSQVVFHLMMPLEGTNDSVIWDFIEGALKYILPVLLVVILMYVVAVQILKAPDTYFEISIKNKKFKIGLNDNLVLKIFRKGIIVISIIVLAVNISYGVKLLGIDKYIEDISKSSKIYEEEYVSPETVNITSPEKKKNIIYIFAESMESSYSDKSHGGGMDLNLIPNLTKLSLENQSFSRGSYLNGANVTANTGWTIAGMVAQTSGVPLSISIGGNELQGYGEFLNGAFSIGEILEKEGYNQLLMFGSDAKFAGRDIYFTQHGNYQIWDVNSAIEEGKMTEEEKIWWGFEDGRLFEWAKEKITELASKDEPFNMTLLTADTHHPDGLVINTPEHDFEYPFDVQYENVVYNADVNICNFIEWIKQQDFYEDTVVVISGDHLSMSQTVSDVMIGDDYGRKTYFTILNSDTFRYDNNIREYTTLDIYPTTLAALGYKIEGERLGLGTNLFSGKETLAEKYGIEYLDNEINRHSSYYDNKILK